jgi:hypothetical protein
LTTSLYKCIISVVRIVDNRPQKLIEAGTVPYLFVEGGYNQRLDIITDPDIPAGHTVWMFDHTDMEAIAVANDSEYGLSALHLSIRGR